MVRRGGDWDIFSHNLGYCYKRLFKFSYQLFPFSKDNSPMIIVSPKDKKLLVGWHKVLKSIFVAMHFAERSLKMPVS